MSPPAGATVFFVGPLPPPLHGFSMINGAMLERLRARGPVAVYDRAPQGRAGVLAFVRALRAAPGGSVYLGLSGGLGQLKDLPYVLAARRAGRPLVVHHHSFAYLRTRPWQARLMLAAATGARHVVLCDCMADALVAGYGIARERVTVLSNAAFLPPAPPPPPRARGAALVLGFLGNITADKGIWLFFEALDRAAAAGLAVQGLVAGPVAGAIAARLARELAARAHCRHLGPVYGEAKAAFYDAIDVLLFPTLYANEAEPVTILEALAAGVPVLANARGCIADLVPADAGAVSRDDAGFVTMALAELQRQAADDEATRAARRHAAHAAFTALREGHARRAEALVASLRP